MQNLEQVKNEVVNILVAPIYETLSQNIMETEEGEFVMDPVTEYIMESVIEYAYKIADQVIENLQETQTDEEQNILLANYQALVEAYAQGLADGLEPLVLLEFQVPEKVKRLAKYLGIGALGAGALAGAAYAGAHADKIGQALGHAKDAIQQKIHSLIQHLHGGAQSAANAAHHAANATQHLVK
jgi:hypothetical protein